MPSKEMDRYVKKVVWPTILNALKSTPFRIFECQKPKIERASSHPRIKNIRPRTLLTIVLEDPNRPLKPGAYPPWYFRLHLESNRLAAALLSWHFSAELPADSDWPSVRDLLLETSGYSCPTQLSVDDRPKNILRIVFEGGGSGESGLALEERIAEKIRAFSDFAETVDELQNDCKNRLLFRRLIQEANRVIET